MARKSEQGSDKQHQFDLKMGILRRKSGKAWDTLEKRDWSELHRIILTVASSSELRNIRIERRSLSEASAKLPFLSYALWLGGPQVVLEAMLNKFKSKDFIEAADTIGRTPIHIACLRQRSPCIVDLLLDKAPLLAALPDRHGNLPIHYAVMAACTADNWKSGHCTDGVLDVLSSLLVLNSATVSVRNRKRESALDLARTFDPTPEKRIYKMLWNTSKVFKLAKAKSSCSEDFTLPPSSFLDYDSSMFMECRKEEVFIDWNAERHQAIGERPHRRNAAVNFL